jgi:hypothetical protein
MHFQRGKLAGRNNYGQHHIKPHWVKHGWRLSGEYEKGGLFCRCGGYHSTPVRTGTQRVGRMRGRVSSAILGSRHPRVENGSTRILLSFVLLALNNYVSVSRQQISIEAVNGTGFSARENDSSRALSYAKPCCPPQNPLDTPDTEFSRRIPFLVGRLLFPIYIFAISPEFG